MKRRSIGNIRSPWIRRPLLVLGTPPLLLVLVSTVVLMAIVEGALTAWDVLVEEWKTSYTRERIRNTWRGPDR